MLFPHQCPPDRLLEHKWHATKENNYNVEDVVTILNHHGNHLSNRNFGPLLDQGAPHQCPLIEILIERCASEGGNIGEWRQEMFKKEKRDSSFKNGKDSTQYHISKHRGMLAADVKRKNATCYHIFEHRAMLSVGVSKEETRHNITFFKMRECCQ